MLQLPLFIPCSCCFDHAAFRVKNVRVPKWVFWYAVLSYCHRLDIPALHLYPELNAVYTAQDGTRNETLNRAAFSLGTLIGGGYLDRSEVEEAYHHFIATGDSGDWDAWSDLHAEDGVWVEHHLGTFRGREAIRKAITDVIKPVPMMLFPVEWYVIDDERGWVVAQIWNRMVDPGDGSLHQAYNFTLLKYAGRGLWSYEEDNYNPKEAVETVQAWVKAGGEFESREAVKMNRL